MIIHDIREVSLLLGKKKEYFFKIKRLRSPRNSLLIAELRFSVTIKRTSTKVLHSHLFLNDAKMSKKKIAKVKMQQRGMNLTSWLDRRQGNAKRAKSIIRMRIKENEKKKRKKKHEIKTTLNKRTSCIVTLTRIV